MVFLEVLNYAWFIPFINHHIINAGIFKGMAKTLTKVLPLSSISLLQRMFSHVFVCTS